MIKLSVDAMGGDHGVDIVVPACADAVNDFPQLDITLFGDEKAIAAKLAAYKLDASRIHIVHAPDIIDNDEAPVLAIRRKANASIVRALTSLAKGMPTDLWVREARGRYWPAQRFWSNGCPAFCVRLWHRFCLR